ncbi:HAMP domain-containing histidine kinase [Methylocaldum sp. BRCS4]|jgi:two-component system sensor histidine kinase BarA|nr:HAMP domain-containing histidine kinase [Methylocaldum sp. BRCS4]
MRKLHRQPRPIQRELMIPALGAVLATSTISAVLSLILLTAQLHTYYLDQSLLSARSLADSSAAVFILGSRDLAERVAGAVVTKTDVSGIAFFGPDGELLFEPFGDVTLPSPLTIEHRSDPYLTSETSANWYLIVPVDARQSGHAADAPATERLGYLGIAVPKQPLHQMLLLVTLITGAVSILVCFPVLAWLNRRIRRMVWAITTLSDAVQRIDPARPSTSLPSCDGPRELVLINHAFTGLLKAIQRHQGSLEALVELRTQELREARDAALRTAQFRAQFMAMLSHEMKTPLNAIYGFAQSIADDLVFSDDGPAATRTRNILLNARKLTDLVTQILEIARMEEAKTELQLEAVNVTEIVRQATDALKPLAEANRNHVSIRCPEKLNAVLDPQKFERLLMNLGTNACKFTECGQIRIEVTLDDDHFEVAVIDSGIGIDPADQELIFEPFRQVDMSHKRRYPGTGLGLAISRHYCDIMGGRLTVSSTPGQGSTFTVRLPRRVDQIAAAARSESGTRLAVAATIQNGDLPDSRMVHRTRSAAAE